MKQTSKRSEQNIKVFIQKGKYQADIRILCNNIQYQYTKRNLRKEWSTMNNVELRGHHLHELFLRKLLKNRFQSIKRCPEKLQQKNLVENTKYIQLQK